MIYDESIELIFANNNFHFTMPCLCATLCLVIGYIKEEILFKDGLHKHEATDLKASS